MLFDKIYDLEKILKRNHVIVNELTVIYVYEESEEFINKEIYEVQCFYNVKKLKVKNKRIEITVEI